MLIATTMQRRNRDGVRTAIVAMLPCLLSVSDARAAFFSGETLDAVADVLAWIVLIAAPIIAIGVFWMVHILPEKIAEKRHHPQASAIKTLCLLSLFFGGLLWPLAWLWAYTKPVLHKLAYGTDVHEHGAEHAVGESRVEETTVIEETVQEIEEPVPPDPRPVTPSRLQRTRADSH